MIVRLIPAAIIVILTTLQVARADQFYCTNGDVTCLIDAINTANSNGEENTINLADNSTYSLTLPISSPSGPTGLPTVTSKIIINGNDATISRSNAISIPDFRIMHVSSADGYLTLNHVTISNGKLSGLTESAKNCAGVMLDRGSRLYLNRSTISNNFSVFIGGGICTSPDSILTVNESKIINNEAVDGGGIFNGFHATLNVFDSVISDNTADFGGGVFNDNGSESYFSGSSVTGNYAHRWGGGIGVISFGSSPDFGTETTIRGSDISNNHGDDGGGIYNNTGKVVISTSVISNNTANFGGAAITNNGALFKVNDSCINENQITSVFNDSAAPLMDAKSNWWGASNGPSGEGLGSGDSVSLNVAYRPFQTSLAPVCKEVVNSAITFIVDPSSYSFTQSTDGCPSGYTGKFNFDSKLRNISQSELSALHIRITELTNENLLVSENKTITVGEVTPILREADYSDGIISPREHVDVAFSICLKSVEPFRFSVDVRADVR